MNALSTGNVQSCATMLPKRMADGCYGSAPAYPKNCNTSGITTCNSARWNVPNTEAGSARTDSLVKLGANDDASKTRVSSLSDRRYEAQSLGHRTFLVRPIRMVVALTCSSQDPGYHAGHGCEYNPATFERRKDSGDESTVTNSVRAIFST